MWHTKQYREREELGEAAFEGVQKELALVEVPPFASLAAEEPQTDKHTNTDHQAVHFLVNSNL